MLLKKYLKLSSPLLALLLASACSGGQDMNEEPANSGVNSEESISGETENEVPAMEEMAPEEPTDGETNTEESTSGETGTGAPASEEITPEEETGEETSSEDPSTNQ